MAKRLELMVTSGARAGQHFVVPSAGLKLGRSSSNDIALPDEELSRNHCLFEPEGEFGLRVIDLASANGTYVNGEDVTTAPRSLQANDRIEVGASSLLVVGESPAPVAPAAPTASAGSLDLGLTPPAPTPPPDTADKKSSKNGLLWVLTAAVILSATVVILTLPSSQPPVVSTVSTRVAAPKLRALSYEKIDADASRIFRYYMTLDEEGVLRVIYDDVPQADRHVDKRGKLDDKAMARILRIFETDGWKDLDRVYAGPSAADENALKSWRIRTIFDSQVREVFVENVPEPEPFKLVREALETFSQNELGIWAIQYSREQLLELSAESARLGAAKWDERDVEYGNLSAAVDAYREALFYLETVNPKPANYEQLREGRDRALAELSQRYKDQRFRVDRAINLTEWETAQRELRILCDMVPNKKDPRHDEARAKLLDVENRMKQMKKGGH